MTDAPVAEAVLDRLRRLKGGALLPQLVGLFLDAAPKRIAEIRAGLGGGDLPSVAFAAHALKSSAGNLGAAGLADLLDRIETAAAAGRREETAGLAEGLEAAFEPVRARLEGERAGPV